MRGFFKVIITVVIIIVLICLATKLGILDFLYLNVSEEQMSNYNGYYYSELSLDDKKIYIKIDETINKLGTTVSLGLHNNYELTKNINQILTAYFYDNPECYYVSNRYVVSTVDMKIVQYSRIELEYTTESNLEILQRNTKLENAADRLLRDSIRDGMTDFEKELAIHDALANHVSYYEYENVETIPSIKHTAYGALVEGEAVCDGYAKAYKLLLEKAGLDSIIISGTTENTPHAWNIVKLNGEYYHVDVTSDKITLDSEKHVVHTYFNVTDKEISKTHLIEKTHKYPECNNTKYNFYIKKGLIVKSNNLYKNLNQIVKDQKMNETLEFVSDGSYSAREIIDALYNIDFNYWRSDNKTSITYSKMGNVYIFVK